MSFIIDPYRFNSPFAAADDFSGISPNSGAVGDANWNRRWTEIENAGAMSIVGNELLMSLSSAAGDNNQGIELNTTISGNFSASVTVDWANLAVSLDNGEYVQVWLRAETSTGGLYLAVVGKFAPDAAFLPGQTGYDFQNSVHFPTSQTGDVDTTGVNVLKLTRSGANTMKASVGDAQYTFGSDANDIVSLSLQILQFGGGTKPAISATFDNFVLLDGSGNPVYI